VGVEVDQVATNRHGASILFEFKGSTQGKRPGMMRTDTTKKALANAFLLNRIGLGPLVILTSHKPKPGTASEAMIKGAGEAVADVICLFDTEETERLKQYLDWTRIPATQIEPVAPAIILDLEPSSMVAIPSLPSIDLSVPVLLMIDARGGEFEQGDPWEEVANFIHYEACCDNSRENCQGDAADRFENTLERLCEKEFLRKVTYQKREDFVCWEITDQGIRELQDRGYMP
jgi:hypothetical protein